MRRGVLVAGLGGATALVLALAGNPTPFKGGQLVPLPTLEAWVANNEKLTLDIIPEADHFFGFGLADVGKSVKRFLGA